MTRPAPLLAVVDVGTGSVRVSFVTPDGAVVASASRPQRVLMGPDGRAEVDAGLVWEAVAACLRDAGARTDPRRVVAVGAAGALGYLLLDGAGAPLGPAMLWMDRRAVAETAELARATDVAALSRVTGRRLDPEVFLAKLRWLGHHEPDRLAAATTFIGLKDEIVRRLTGVVGIDPTHAAYTMLYDVGARRWSPELVALAGLAADRLPALRLAHEVAGRVTADAATATGLPEGVPVVTGTSDGTAAGLLAGADPGVAVNVTGTSDVVMAQATGPRHDAAGRTLVNPHPLGAGFMVGGVLGTTGGTLRWLVERLCPDLTGDDRYARVDAEAAAVPVGARGLVCLPGFAGERSPRWNASARGALVGLDLTHGRAEIARAVMEGVALAVRAVVGALRSLGVDVRRLRVVGGGARSDFWSQLRADATGLPVERPRSVEGTTTSVALLAGLGVGLYTDLADGARRLAAIERVFEPRAAEVDAYASLATLADRIYAGLEPAFPDLAPWRTRG